MSDFQQSLTEHRRLSALRALTVVPFDHELRRDLLGVLVCLPGNTGNISLCRDLLAEAGYELSRDKLAGCAAWLAEQGLVSMFQQGTTDVVTVTTRGEDVAAGHASLPGVAPKTDFNWLIRAMGDYGLVLTLEITIEIVDWLISYFLIRCDRNGNLTLTRRGEEVANGRATIEGVKKPSAGAIMAAAAVAAHNRLSGG